MSTSPEADQICRTCLSKAADMTCVFSTHEIEESATSVCDLIWMCASIQICEGDELPEQVCTRCINEMTRAFTFRKLCQKSDELLKEKLNSTQNIEEDVKIEPEKYSESISKVVIKNEYVNDDVEVEVTDSTVIKADADATESSIDFDEEMSDDEEWPCTPPELVEAASAARLNLLPIKSRDRYEKVYKQFLNWCEEKRAVNYTENVLLAYFVEKTKQYQYQSSSLWTMYSMIKATLIAKHNTDISKYSKLIAFLKQKSNGCRAKISSTFTKDQIEKFLYDAPDKTYLMMKACTVLGVAGACHCEDLTRLTIDDIEDVGSAFLIKIPRTKTKTPKIFAVFDKKINDISMLDICRKYAALRAPHTKHRRYFVFFNHLTGKCSTQVVGINKIGKIPSEIAKFLQLPNPGSYTGHCFRRSSAISLADAFTGITSAKQLGESKLKAVTEDSGQMDRVGRINKQIQFIKMEDDENLFSCNSPEVVKDEQAEKLSLLPEKSKVMYEKEYAGFVQWCLLENIQNYSENVLLTYFLDKSKRYKASSLWTHYSMLKATLLIRNSVDISRYSKLIAFLKTKSENHEPKKSNILSRDQIGTFIREAPDSTFLMIKVALILGIAGACRREELTKLSVNDIEDLESVLIVKLRGTKAKTRRTFTVFNNNEDFLGIYRKYVALRPQHTDHNRFFLTFKNGKCSTQPVGKNTFGLIPGKIAEYLKLPNPSKYTGHCFRHSSATVLAESGEDIAQLKRHRGWQSNRTRHGQ